MINKNNKKKKDFCFISGEIADKCVKAGCALAIIGGLVSFGLNLWLDNIEKGERKQRRANNVNTNNNNRR